MCNPETDARKSPNLIRQTRTDLGLQKRKKEKKREKKRKKEKGIL